MKPRISSSDRFWFGIGTLYLSSRALAVGSEPNIDSGDLRNLASQSSERRCVTPSRSGPSFLPSPPEMAWQATHLDSNDVLACSASGSDGAAEAGRLWCSCSASAA